jgi:hypothetical protein
MARREVTGRKMAATADSKTPCSMKPTHIPSKNFADDTASASRRSTSTPTSCPIHSMSPLTSFDFREAAARWRAEREAAERCNPKPA